MISDLDVFEQIERDVLAARDESRDLAGGWRDWTRELRLALIARECAETLKSAREEAFKQLAKRLGLNSEAAEAFLTVDGATPEQIMQGIDTMFGGNT